MGNTQTSLNKFNGNYDLLEQKSYFNSLVPAFIIIIAGFIIRLSDLKTSIGFLTISFVLLSIVLSNYVLNKNIQLYPNSGYFPFTVIAIMVILLVVIIEDIFKIKSGINSAILSTK